jgi:hypothetical protein
MKNVVLVLFVAGAALLAGCYRFSTKIVTVAATSAQRDDICALIAGRAKARGLQIDDASSACAAVSLEDGGITFRPQGDNYLVIQGYGKEDDAAEHAVALGESLIKGTPAAAEPPPANAPRLALMGPPGASGNALVTGLLEVIGDRVAQGGVAVITPAEINAVLTMQNQSDIVGCEENVACIAELAGAVGADAVLTLAVGQVGPTQIIGLKIIDLGKASVVARQTVRVHANADAIGRVELAVDAAVGLWRGARR